MIDDRNHGDASIGVNCISDLSISSWTDFPVQLEFVFPNLSRPWVIRKS